MLNLLTIDLSKFGRTLRGINVVVDVNGNVLVPITTEVAIRVFGDSELLRNAIKDAATDTMTEDVLNNISSYSTLEDVEEKLISVMRPVSVRFLKEKL